MRGSSPVQDNLDTAPPAGMEGPLPASAGAVPGVHCNVTQHFHHESAVPLEHEASTLFREITRCLQLGTVVQT